MNRVPGRCVILIALLLAGPGIEAATIRGVPDCAYWLRDREPGGNASYFNAMWLVGYLSGAAVHSDRDILRTIDSESIAAWMDRYCKANSSSNIAEGSEMLFAELAHHLPAAATNAVSPAPTPSATVMALTTPLPAAMPAASPVKLVSAVVPAAMPSPAPDKPVSQAPAPATPLPAHVDVAPPEPGTPQNVESPAALLNAPTYLPRALMLAGALPLGTSRYQFKAEHFAKANGCVRPAATMSIRTATSETFGVICADGAALSVRCDPECRDLQ